MTTELAKLTAEQKKDPTIAFALKVRSAFRLKNYYRFFKLHREAPKMSSYLMDWFSERLRKDAMKCIIKSYVSQWFEVLSCFAAVYTYKSHVYLFIYIMAFMCMHLYMCIFRRVFYVILNVS